MSDYGSDNICGEKTTHLQVSCLHQEHHPIREQGCPNSYMHLHETSSTKGVSDLYDNYKYECREGFFTFTF